MAGRASNGKTKAERTAEAVAKAVNAGKAWNCETVDFADPNRPPTCIEVDFPIIPINQIAVIEGNAGKPIYQMSKWWARRRSSVFRAILLASAIKAPSDPAEAAKQVWQAYYGNHQKLGAFKQLKVADIFMGGGTTIVEGSRLGMQMYGNDLNPVAWFIVRNAMAKVDRDELGRLLAEIEREVKPQIMPFYTCDCPRGHQGNWTRIRTGEVMGDAFDPLSLTPDERKDYEYYGPEIIYVFWAKHGPCQVTGCGHRTPIMSSPVMAVKSLTVKAWEHKCPKCQNRFDIEERDARMAPGVPLVIAETERSFAVAELSQHTDKPKAVTCPLCEHKEQLGILGAGKRKKVELSLLVHPEWLKGEPSKDLQGRPYGGSADDPVEDTIRWNNARAAKCRLVEVRGKLPDEVICPETGVAIKTGKEGGTVPAKSNFTCMESTCGRKQDILGSIKRTVKTGPVAAYAIQCFCRECEHEKQLYRGRYFLPIDDPAVINAAFQEWDSRSKTDLKEFWPKSEVPYGFMTGIANGDIRTGHGFTHWWKMFNHRQLLLQAQLLRAIMYVGDFEEKTRLFVLGSHQLHVRNQCMFSFWHLKLDKLAPALSNSNYHPKSTVVEVGAFCPIGYGPWRSSTKPLSTASNWVNNPWDLVSVDMLANEHTGISEEVAGKSEKVFPGDLPTEQNSVDCTSSTDLKRINSESYDLVVTDPPFGGLLHYSELADFFYVWLRLVLKEKYPDYFEPEYTPKALEAVANRARQPEDADGFYQRLLTECWKEAHRILKPGGILVFTFHHSEDEPWVAVLESLFDAGFGIEATYPIRSDETKGEGEFGSKKIEYDIIHVCRKRNKEPKPISWAKLRRLVIQNVRDIKDLLEHHQKAGLLEADLQVIRRGEALELFSKHYDKVYKDQDSPMTVLEALLGINQVLDEEAGGIKEPPPHNAEPFTRMLLRLFDGNESLDRDQFQKFLRGTGSATSDFTERGWVHEEKKVFYLTSPLDIARNWTGKHRKGMISDYDQAVFLVGACFEGSGVNANETLNNENFRPHPALANVLKWLSSHGATNQIRNAATLAAQLYKSWETRNQAKAKQTSLFDELGEEDS